MSEAVGFFWLPTLIAVALLLSRRWPFVMRRVSRGLAVTVGLTVVCLVISGLAHGSQVAAMIHRWLSHGLLFWAWSAIPLAIGVTVARARAGPILAVGQVLGLLLLLVVLFVASFTGYLGPSHGPSDALSVTRFRVLHYGLWPSVSIALVAGWYHEPGADRGRGSRSHDAILTEG